MSTESFLSSLPLPRLRSFEDYRALYARSIDDPAGFWAEQASAIPWMSAWERVLEADFSTGDTTWFRGGRLNASVACVDRHADRVPDKTALHWIGNAPGEERRLSFAQLRREVGRMGNLLRASGVRKGDRVCLSMPMVPELVVAMLACARIGAVHSVVFAGFSAEALRGRIDDAAPVVVVTADAVPRGAREIPLKPLVDEALVGNTSVKRVLVLRRTGLEVSMTPERDVWLHDALRTVRAECPVEPMDAEDPLFLLYTSGSTGRPKGLVHTTGGYLVYANATFRYVFDARDDDVHFCTADAGWITGHTYVVYGPLSCGVTTVLFEGIPLWPAPDRYWQAVEATGATIFYTAPTALRSLIREGDRWVRGDRSSLRLLGSVGEPINPEVWRWYHRVVGQERCPVIDTWWQTETGGILIAPLAEITPLVPGAATLPFFGVRPVVCASDGTVLWGEAQGELCIDTAWPGQARTIAGDHQRFIDTYFARHPGRYFTGDGCRRDAAGNHWITGRIDDVLNVAGHRLGTAELESALVAHPAVAEAAVVGIAHPVKGQGIGVWVVLKPGFDTEAGADMAAALRLQLRQAIGALATPDRISLVAGLPKTRSGKILRRLLRKIADGEDSELGDTSTLADAGVVEQLRQAVAY